MLDGRTRWEGRTTSYQVAEHAGVTVRTLHHHGEIGLLSASDRTHAGTPPMAAYDASRPTQDIDLYARALPSNGAAMLRVVREVAERPFDDGLAIARIAYHVDVNVGDPVQPPPQRIVLPRVLGGELEINGYPRTVVYAEKIVTMLERRTANTRWRDYLDIHVLCRRHRERRRTAPQHHDGGCTPAGRTRAAAPSAVRLPRDRSTQMGRLAATPSISPIDSGRVRGVLDLVMPFADPVLSGETPGLVWRPNSRLGADPVAAPQEPAIGYRLAGGIDQRCAAGCDGRRGDLDCYNDDEQVTGLFTMIEQSLEVPFETLVLGVGVTVERVELSVGGDVVAVCRRGGERQSIPVLDLRLPTPRPQGAEWIEAFRHWSVRGR